MKKQILTFLTGFLVCSIIAVGILLSYIFKSPSPPPPPDDNYNNRGDITHQVSLKDVEQVAKLISVEYHMADVVDYNDKKIWPFKDHKILVIAKAKIFAGFDLNKAFHINI